MTAASKPPSPIADRIAIGLALSLVLWLVTQVAAINGNRYTAADARESERELRKAMTRVDTELQRIWETIAGLPPDTFEAKFDRVVERLHQLELELEKLRK